MKFAESPISHIFGSKIRSEVAKKNSKLSVLIQPYFLIPLDIDACDSITDSLRLFLSKEHIDDGAVCSSISSYMIHDLIYDLAIKESGVPSTTIHFDIILETIYFQ